RAPFGRGRPKPAGARVTRAAARAGRFARRPARRPARGGFRKVHGARVAAVRSREAPLRAALIRVLTRAVIGDE
ncbi:hypothetical protein, partial [Burkholderia pseudomallei]